MAELLLHSYWRATAPYRVRIGLAIKGLARYPELTLTDSRVAEKFIIGTLASVLFAAGCAGVTAWLTGLTR